MTRGRNYIGGEWKEPRSGKYYANVNPATGEVLGHFPVSTEADVKEAIASARDAFPGWKRTPAPKRAEIAFRLGEIIKARKEEYAQQMTQEMGKVLTEARGDVQEAIDMIYYAAGEGRRMDGYVAPSELPRKYAMAMRVPLGVVAAITPWNFPMAIPTWKLIPAIVAGNTVVFKPATYTPLSAYNLVKSLEDAGLPPGVVNLVYAPGAQFGKVITTDDRIDMVSFTGSTAVGTRLLEKVAPQNKRIHTEMGGKNAIIVLSDANIELAVDGIIWSAFGTTGQRCTACSRVIVEREAKSRLLSLLVERTKSLRLGNGLDSQTDVGPIVSEAQLKLIDKYVKIGLKEGGKLLCGGEPATEGELAKGNFYKPTIFDEITPDMTIAQEEIFGPVLAVIEAEDIDEAIAINNQTKYGLSTSVYTTDVNKAFYAMEEIDTGLVYINAGTIGAEVHLPFGGMRATGNGHREAGKTCFDTFTEWKTIFADYSGRLQKAQGIE